MEVFPTDWSPKKTSLYLASGASDAVAPADAALFGGAGRSADGCGVVTVSGGVDSLILYSMNGCNDAADKRRGGQSFCFYSQ